MPTPGGASVVKDSNAVPVPQGWDYVNQTYDYAGFNGSSKEIFFSPAPLIPINSANATNPYAVGFQFKAVACYFKQATGQYKGSVSVWIMAFDTATTPPTNAVPIMAASLPPAIGGTDQNWNLTPSSPYRCMTGLYIGISTTGGVFTATTSTDFTGIVEVLGLVQT